MSYDLGDTVPLGVTITDAAGDPTAAASVTLTITRPDGTVESGTTPSSPVTGRYEYDYVPTVAGLHQVLWESTGPAAVFGPDAVDVRPRTRGVISLTDLRDYLNKSGTGTAATAEEGELRDLLGAAVERVERHTGTTLAADGQITQLQVLAVKLVAADFWRTQRARSASRVAAAPQAIDADSSPYGTAPLEVRLTELLGPAVSGKGSALPPVGVFPDVAEWPDTPLILDGTDTESE